MKTYWDSSALIEALHDPNLRSRLRPADNATRPHSLAEVFSTLTKGVNFRYAPADAAKMVADLTADLAFVELDSAETLSAVRAASSQGVRGARIHDLMHATAARKWGADKLLTLDAAGFSTLKLQVKVSEP
ncbi:MAG TPA: PIN domain-containing protein [Verrucomicrobiae bacterium]|nr:PIN domain-containing protein [Verrucomicrobiae bacterium]